MTIDLNRAATLMDVVQKVASVAPTMMAISNLAMMELKAMNEDAQRRLDTLGQQRLKAEQEAAAELNEHNRLTAEKQVQIDAEIAERTALSNAAKPITIMPGEPVPDVVRKAAGETLPSDDPTPHELVDDTLDSRHDDAPVQRRV